MTAPKAPMADARPRLDIVVVAMPMTATDLVAQLLALSARHRDVPPARTAIQRLRFAGWVFDLTDRHLVAPGGGILPMSGREFVLLRVFATRPRRVLSRDDLAQLTQRDGGARPSLRAIDVYVSRLRRILNRGGGASLISTMRNAGYIFNADVVRA